MGLGATSPTGKKWCSTRIYFRSCTFSLFTNDLPKHIEEYATLMMYGDDTDQLITEKGPVNLEVRSYSAMNITVQYCHNMSIINDAKTQMIIMGSRKDEADHLFNLVAAKEAKYFGLTDQDLKWTPHIDNQCMRLSSGLQVIKRMKSIKDTATVRKKAVRALARLLPMESCQSAFVNLSILTVVSLCVLETVIYVHDCAVHRGYDIHS